MKKLLAIMLSVLLSLSMVACGEADKTSDNTNNSDNSESIVTAIQQTRYEVVAAPIDESPVIITSATDNEYNYYLLDLGYAKNVPISSGMPIEYNGQTPISVTFERSCVTQESVSNSLTMAVSQTISTTSMGSAKFEVSQKFKYLIGETSLGACYSRQWGTVEENSNSTSDTYTTATSTTEQLTSSISYTIGEHAEVAGTYRLALVGTCDIYAFIQTTCDNSRLENIIYSFSARQDTRLKLEYDKDGLFDGNTTDKIVLPENYYQTLPIPETYIESGGLNDGTFDDEMEIQYNTISVTMNRYNCNDGNNYNKNEPEESADWRSRHNGYEIGLLNLYGCQQMEGNYRISEPNKFAIRYQVLKNTDDLPRVGTDLTHVENDDATSVKGTNISSRVGYGAYWVRITYTDDSQIQYNKTNILKYATNGTIIDIVTQDDIDITKTIKKIEIVVVYELYAGAAGFLGIWWHEYSNWRCEYTYEFM